MNKTAHILIGGILGIILILLTHYYLNWFDFKNIINIGLIAVIIYVYSLLADADMKNSTITWTFIPIGLVSTIYGAIYQNEIFLVGGIALITITFLAAQFLPHRGFTHSIIFGILVSLPWIYLSYPYAILAFVCYYSHLCGDKLGFKFI